jgi:hypothetical protein
MSKLLYIKDNIPDLSLEFGDILEYNEKTGMFTMGKKGCIEDTNYQVNSTKTVELDYATAIDIITDNKASIEEVSNKEVADFKDTYNKIEEKIGLEDLNIKLNTILNKLDRINTTNFGRLNSIRRIF